ncbi:MarR family transcriptional regulator [Mycolicibacterium sp. CBMA 226]|uniref:MarR family winged helix-turn-helix transcriptional regulator n=1 Tax=Mycolicibacterium sp. CBMA 226 TaxID=2606611 RepID=UPI0028BD30E8|nr:MarR family transcriptional regulator [Mycolicibacterium sp. CBMA 226]
MGAEKTDAVDVIQEQWRRERPDLDGTAMAVLGRLGRLAAAASDRIESVFTAHGLQRGEFDVLATLRRSGKPYELNPSGLADTLMMSRAGMTNRLDRLEKAGLVRRIADVDDRRAIRVALTNRGLHLVDIAVTEHFENETNILSVLSDRDRHEFDRITRLLLASFEDGA